MKIDLIATFLDCLLRAYLPPDVSPEDIRPDKKAQAVDVLRGQIRRGKEVNKEIVRQFLLPDSRSGSTIGTPQTDRRPSGAERPDSMSSSSTATEPFDTTAPLYGTDRPPSDSQSPKRSLQLVADLTKAIDHVFGRHLS